MQIENRSFLKILNGNFTSLPKDPYKQVRIFLSSTFSDTHTERDYLIANIYPKLKAYCKTAHNLDFQVLDMRWGINNEVSNTHMATTICLNEIKICQQSSLGPNRYGNRALPTRIIQAEYEKLRLALSNTLGSLLLIKCITVLEKSL